jgi:hypothetical protein
VGLAFSRPKSTHESRKETTTMNREHSIDVGRGRRLTLETDGETFRVVAERHRGFYEEPLRVLQIEARIDWDE